MLYLVPQYLTLTYVQGFLGDKIAISVSPYQYPDAIPDYIVNDLIAKAESDVVFEFLNHFQFPTPIEFTALATTFPSTYAFLVDLLTAKAIVKILQFYYSTVGENKGDDYMKNAEKNYAFLLNRLLRKLDNGLYAYINYPGLCVNPLATINKVYHRSITGFIGGQRQTMADYAQNQTLDPQDSFTLSFNNPLWVWPITP